MGWVLEIYEAQLSIKTSSLSSVKALFISLLLGLFSEKGLGGFPWIPFGKKGSLGEAEQCKMRWAEIG